jgi:Domain of unknown function (DUF4203)
MLVEILAGAFAFVLGLALLFYGYRSFLVLLPVFGFFAGLWVGAQIIEALFGNGFFADVTGFVVGGLLGLAFAILSYLFYELAVIIIAAAIGYALGVGFMQALSVDAAWLQVLVGAVVAVVVAFLAWRFDLQRYVITALTAIAGANAVLLGPLLIFNQIEIENVTTVGNAIQPVLKDSWFWLLVWAAIAIVGFLYQIRHDRPYTFSPDDYVTTWN